LPIARLRNRSGLDMLRSSVIGQQEQQPLLQEVPAKRVMEITPASVDSNRAAERSASARSNY
jgi:hypothetical protein